MEPSVETKRPAALRRIGGLRASILAEVETLDQAVLNRRPSPGAWSPLELVEHLVLAEEEVLAGLHDPSRMKSRRRSLRHHVRFVLVLGVLVFRIRVKVPSRTMRPSGEVSLTELRARWEESHRRFRNHLETCSHRERGLAIFRHPVAGPITTRQSLWMLEAHLRLHRAQLRERMRGLRVGEGASRTVDSPRTP